MAGILTRARQTTQEAAETGAHKIEEIKEAREHAKLSEKISENSFLYATGASVILSAFLFTRKSRDWGLFVGQWVPSILTLGLFYKLLKQSKEKS